MDCQYAFLDGQAVSAMIVGDVERCRSAASKAGHEGGQSSVTEFVT